MMIDNKKRTKNEDKRLRSLEQWRENEVIEKLNEVNAAGGYTWTLTDIKKHYNLKDAQLNSIRTKSKR